MENLAHKEVRKIYFGVALVFASLITLLFLLLLLLLKILMNKVRYEKQLLLLRKREEPSITSSVF